MTDTNHHLPQQQDTMTTTCYHCVTALMRVMYHLPYSSQLVIIQVQYLYVQQNARGREILAVAEGVVIGIVIWFDVLKGGAA